MVGFEASVTSVHHKEGNGGEIFIFRSLTKKIGRTDKGRKKERKKEREVYMMNY